MFNWSILGTCPELNYDDSCKVDEVVLKFKVDEEYIDNPDSEYAEENPEFAGIKRYNVFRFFEEDNILLPVKTDVDVENNTVSATVSDLGTYCLIDMECFLQDIVQGAEDFENENSEKTENEELPTLQTFSLFAARTLSAAAETAEISEAEPDKKVKPAIKYTDEFNIVFMYDSRDCTSDEDYAYFYENICDTAEFIFNQSQMQMCICWKWKMRLLICHTVQEVIDLVKLQMAAANMKFMICIFSRIILMKQHRK